MTPPPTISIINKGDGTFEDASYASGYRAERKGRETASMGIAVGDYLNNGRSIFYNTDFSDDYNVLYRNDGDANFTDISYQVGHRRRLRFPFSAGATGFIDYDNDGWKDLFIVNGHVYPAVDQARTGARPTLSGLCSFTT